MNTSVNLHIKASDEIRTTLVEPPHDPDGYVTVDIDGAGSHAYLFLHDPVQALRFAKQIRDAAWDLQGRRQMAARVPA